MSAPLQATLDAWAVRLGHALLTRGERLVTAESCTGGWVAMTLTGIPGSSVWFERGWVTYSNEAKQQLLGVQALTLIEKGAVSEATVLEMAEGGLTYAPADWAISISGIAGPGGGSPDKPVGTVCFGLAGRQLDRTPTTTRCFTGDRHAVRAQAVAFALASLVMTLESESGALWPPVP